MLHARTVKYKCRRYRSGGGTQLPPEAAAHPASLQTPAHRPAPQATGPAMSVPGFCCGAFGAVGDDDDEMVFLIGAEAEDADGLQKPHLDVVYPGAVCIAQEELYRKLLDAALASNSPFSNLCRMYDMGFRGTLLVRHLVTCAEEPAFKFSHLKLLVDMGVLVPSPPLASDSDVPRSAAAATGMGESPRTRALI